MTTDDDRSGGTEPHDVDDDPVAAVRELRETVDSAEAVSDVTPESLASDPDDGWVAVGGLVRSPGRERVALVRTEWSDGWVLPGGGVEPEDDSLEATLRREVREETGLDVTVEQPLVVERQTLAAPDRSTRGLFVVFSAVAAGESFDSDPGDNDGEIEAVGWFEDPVTAFSGPSDLVAEVVERDVRGD